MMSPAVAVQTFNGVILGQGCRDPSVRGARVFGKGLMVAKMPMLDQVRSKRLRMKAAEGADAMPSSGGVPPTGTANEDGGDDGDGNGGAGAALLLTGKALESLPQGASILFYVDDHCKGLILCDIFCRTGPSSQGGYHTQGYAR